MEFIYNKTDLINNFIGDEDILIELIDHFLLKKVELISAVIKSIDSKNSHDLKIAAHTLKGVISNFYSSSLTEICYDLEKKGNAGNFENINDTINELIEKIDILSIEIQELKSELIASLN